MFLQKISLLFHHKKNIDHHNLSAAKPNNHFSGKAVQ